MKKLIIASFAIVLLMAVSACSHFPHDDSGDLGRHWMLTEVETLSTGETEDYRPKKIFWAVQGIILEVFDKTPNSSTRQRGIVFHYEHKDNTLRLSEPRYNIREEGDPKVEDVEVLKYYGINGLEEVFSVESLDGTKMVLRSEQLRLRFKSF